MFSLLSLSHLFSHIFLTAKISRAWSKWEGEEKGLFWMSSNLEADAGLSCTSERCEVESCSGGHVYRWRGVHKSLRTSLSFSTGKSHLFLLVDVTPPTRLRKLFVHCHHPSAVGTPLLGSPQLSMQHAWTEPTTRKLALPPT